MIKVCFPPGCYGSYIGRCIFNYTNLRQGPFKQFDFGKNGNSHGHRDNPKTKYAIRQGHIDTIAIDLGDKLVTVLPCVDHYLDYYNNQFFKQKYGLLISYILSQMSRDEAEHKLSTYWNYKGKFNNTVPHWIMREWCSFWISGALDNAYCPTKYSQLNSIAKITTQDIFENYTEAFNDMISKLELIVNVDAETIHSQHKTFLSLQKFHNSQLKCQQYVTDVLAGTDNTIKINSIFDEAYIQHLLRQHNVEIQCDGLDTFPINTIELKKLTFNA